MIAYLKKFFSSIPWQKILLVFLVSRIVLEFVGVWGRAVFGLAHNFIYTHYTWLDIWGAWDTGWYLPLAQHGYSKVASLGSQANFAFFPLYPAVMRVLGQIIHNEFLAGIIISNLCLLMSAGVIYLLAKKRFSGQAAFFAVTIVLLFPTSFFFSAVLSEGLFLLLSATTLYFIENNNWPLVGVFGFFAALTRPVGILLFVPAIWKYFHNYRQHNFLTFAWLFLIPAGTLSFVLYIWRLTGNIFAVANIQSAWGRSFGKIIAMAVRGQISFSIRNIVAALFVVVVLFLLFKFKNLFQPAWLVYVVLLMLVPLSSGLDNMPRYLSVAVPIYPVLGYLFSNRPKLFWTCAGIFFILQCIGFILWTIGTGILV